MASPAAVLSVLIRAKTGEATDALVRFNQALDATRPTCLECGEHVPKGCRKFCSASHRHRYTNRAAYHRRKAQNRARYRR